MKKNISTIMLIGVFVIGLLIFMYPTISEIYNAKIGSYAIESYNNEVVNLDNSEIDKILKEASEYNDELSKKQFQLVNGDVKDENYGSKLNASKNNIMGYIEIKKIGVKLPIYHGTSEPVLQKAIGHIEGSALPIGGQSTHSVLSGHRGLPSAKLFTNLDKLEKEDKIVIRVLNETITYKVTSINVVEPDEVELLKPQNEKELLTLVTCTPYGVNSHRLLVTGERCENSEDNKEVTTVNTSSKDKTKIVVVIIIGSILTTLLLVRGKKRKNKNREV